MTLMSRLLGTGLSLTRARTEHRHVGLGSVRRVSSQMLLLCYSTSQIKVRQRHRPGVAPTRRQQQQRQHQHQVLRSRLLHLNRCNKLVVVVVLVVVLVVVVVVVVHGWNRLARWQGPRVKGPQMLSVT